MQDSRREKGWLIKKLRAQFFTGMLVVVPIAAAILILVWVFNSVDNVLQPIVRSIWHRDIPGVGFGVTIVIIYVVGVIASNVIGKEIVRFVESQLARVPVFRQLYTGIRQIMHSFSASNKTGFTQVVLVEFPRKGMMAIGFVTNELIDHSGEKLLSIFIPTAPNPVSGFLQLMKENEVIRTKISVDDALKMVVSAGSMTPAGVGAKLP